MEWRLAGLALAAGIVSVATCAHAMACADRGDAAATRLRVDEPRVRADMAIQLHFYHARADDRWIAAQRRKAWLLCERARFAVGDNAYVLREGGSDSVPRLAAPQSGGAFAYLLSVPGLSGIGAPFVGLLTDARGTTTLWRAYDKVPTDEVIVNDMRAALSGRLAPLLVLRNGHVQIATQP